MTIQQLKKLDSNLFNEIRFTLSEKVFDRFSEVTEEDYRKFKKGNGHVTFSKGTIFISIPYEEELKDIKLNSMWFGDYETEKLKSDVALLATGDN